MIRFNKFPDNFGILLINLLDIASSLIGLITIGFFKPPLALNYSEWSVRKKINRLKNV